MEPKPSSPQPPKKSPSKFGNFMSRLSSKNLSTKTNENEGGNLTEKEEESSNIPTPSIGTSGKRGSLFFSFVAGDKKDGYPRKETSLSGRAALEGELRKVGKDNTVDLNVVVKLSLHCLENANRHSAVGQRSKLLYCGALLMDWAQRKGIELTGKEIRLLAKAHTDTWISRGIEAEQYNLDRAQELYEQAVKNDDISSDCKVWLEYSRVLQYIGDKENGTRIMKSVLKNFDGDDDYPSYLFYAAGALKAQGEYDQAANYFFEATQVGPPRLFSKLEMMFLISRNIEESGKDKDEPCEDAYQMVYEHLVLEGQLSGDLSYDDWISDSKTWRNLADKCMIHNMYSLATDLYAQGIQRDPQAFRKPKIWFGFAKACKRCGRTSDAQLSIKQALTIDPYNKQLLRALECWQFNNPDFELLIDKDITAVLDKLPPHFNAAAFGIARLQAFHRGLSERAQLAVGVGSRNELMKRMSACVGVVLGGQHAVMIKAAADWLGRIRSLSIIDLRTDNVQTLNLSTPFVPMRERGIPRRLQLSISCSVDNGRRSKKGSKNDNNNSPATGKHLVSLKFVDLETSEFLERRLVITHSAKQTSYANELSLAEGSNEVIMVFQPASTNTSADVLDTASLVTVESVGKDKDSHTISERDASIVESICLTDDPSLEIVTDIIDVDILRGSFRHSDILYLYRIYHEAATSNANIFQVSSGKRVHFTLNREHLDRAYDLKTSLKLFIELIAANPLLASFMFNKEIEKSIGNENLTSRRETLSNGKTCIVSITLKSESLLATVRLEDPNNLPILGSHFEMVTDDALNDPNRPLKLKKLARDGLKERAVSRGTHSAAASTMSFEDTGTANTNAITSGTGGATKNDKSRSPSPSRDTPAKKLSPIASSTPSSKPTQKDKVSSPTLSSPSVDNSQFRVEEKLTEQLNSLKLGGSLEEDSIISIGRGSSDKSIQQNPNPSKASSLAEGENSSPSPLLKQTQGFNDISNKSLSISSIDSNSNISAAGRQDSLKKIEVVDGENAPPLNTDVIESDKQINESTNVDESVNVIAIDTENEMDIEKDEGEEGDEFNEEYASSNPTYIPTNNRKMSSVIEDLSPEKQAARKAAKEKRKAEKAAIEAKNLEKKERSNLKKAEKEEAAKNQKAKTEAPISPPKKFAKKATGIKLNFLEHQQTRMTTMDLLHERVAKAIFQCKQFEAKELLLSRASAAMVIYEEKIALYESEVIAAAAAAVLAASAAPAPVAGKGKAGKKPLGKSSTFSGTKSVSVTKKSIAKGDGTGTGESAATTSAAAAMAEAMAKMASLTGSAETPPIAIAAIPTATSAVIATETSIPEEREETTIAPVDGGVSEEVSAAAIDEFAIGNTSNAVAVDETFPVGDITATSAIVDTFPIEGSVVVDSEGNTMNPTSTEATSQFVTETGEIMGESVTIDESIGVEGARSRTATDDYTASTYDECRISPKRKRLPFSPAKKALTRKQKENLRKPLRVEDLPPSAFESAQGLIAALRQISTTTSDSMLSFVPRPAVPPLGSPEAAAYDFIESNRPSPTQRYSMDVNKKAAEFNEKKHQNAKMILNQMLAPKSNGGLTSAPQSRGSSRPNSKARSRKTSSTLSEPLAFNALYTQPFSQSAGIAKSSRPLSVESPLRNPLIFMQPGVEQAGPLFRQSIDKFKNQGYSDGNNLYQAHWRKKVFACLQLFPTAALLKKAIVSLQKVIALPISQMEAFCALSDSNGSVTEALGKLSSEEFRREVKLVCTLLPIENIVALLSNGAESITQPASFSLELYEKNKASVGGNRKAGGGGNLMSMSLESGTSITQSATSILNSKASSSSLSPIRANNNRNANQLTIQTSTSISATSTMGGERNPVSDIIAGDIEQSVLRIHSVEAVRTLPHLNMMSDSPAVIRRANAIQITPGKRHLDMRFPFSPSTFNTDTNTSVSMSMFPFPPDRGDVTDPNYAQDGSLPIDFSAPPPSFASPPPAKRFFAQSFSMSALEDTTNTSAYTGNSENNGNLLRKTAGKGAASSPSRGTVVPVVPFAATLRLGTAIDLLLTEQQITSSSPLQVLCRRDALRAAEDETLAKSSKSRFQKLSTTYQNEQRKVRLETNRKLLQQQFYDDEQQQRLDDDDDEMMRNASF